MVELAQSGETVDVVFMDPPRAGSDLPFLNSVLALAPKRIVYISCDPATLARDVALLKKRGYALKNAQAADLFPRCSHVESIICLTRHT